MKDLRTEIKDKLETLLFIWDKNREENDAREFSGAYFTLEDFREYLNDLKLET